MKAVKQLMNWPAGTGSSSLGEIFEMKGKAIKFYGFWPGLV